MDRVDVRWTAERNGNEGTVHEIRSDGTKSDFGPMPAHVVPAFIRGRQIIVRQILRSQGFLTKVTDEELEPGFEKYFTAPQQ